MILDNKEIATEARLEATQAQNFCVELSDDQLECVVAGGAPAPAPAGKGGGGFGPTVATGLFRSAIA